MRDEYKSCTLCPRGCGVDRSQAVGVCGSPDVAIVNRVSRHMYEEPAICGAGGAGTVFFSGCSLGCVYCQNKKISTRAVGRECDGDALAEIFLMLDGAAVSCIDLVTPTHFLPDVRKGLLKVKHRLSVPVVYNSGGYESTESLRSLDGLIDIYMPDLKYYSPELSLRYSNAPDYYERATEAIAYMYSTLGAAVWGEDGMLRRGLIVRHLVLPGCRKDSVSVLKGLASIVSPSDIVLSLMSQYTPDFYDGEDRCLRRRLTSFEYDSVLCVARELGFEGFMQAHSSANAKYTPPFGDEFCLEL